MNNLTKIIRILAFLLLLGLVPAVLAQNECPAIVQQAFEAVQTACANTARNQACYGNVALTATPREGVSSFTFEKVGDITDAANIQSLQLTGMNVDEGHWGVVMMKLQANIPDVLPGQNATVLLFGDVEVANAVPPTVELEATTGGAANIRRRPTADAQNVIASLAAGATVTATGRLADGTWIRIRTTGDNLGQTGWVAAGLLSSTGDLNTLDVVEADSQTFSPMQAFYLKTGFRDRPCAEAPESGILVQGPKGFRLNFNVNSVDISMGSTLFLQTAEREMRVNVVEGAATVTNDGISQIVPAGTFTEVTLDEEGEAIGAPELPQPYEIDDFDGLPLDDLPEDIEVAPELDEDELEQAMEDALYGDDGSPDDEDEALPPEPEEPVDEEDPLS